MGSGNTLSRRGFLGALTALGSISLAACATNSTKASRLLAASRATGQLPPRGEFVVRNAYVLTMDPKLGDIPRGDVHVRNGIRARFSYGYSRNLQLKPEQTADLADIARVRREWFGSSNDGLLTLGFASRGPGDTPPQVYRREWENARSLGLPITQHAGRSLQ